MKVQWRLAFNRFASAVHERLLKGEEHCDADELDADPLLLLSEIEVEIKDLAGWGFILWTRLERVRAALVETARNQDRRLNDEQ
jgi:hypothetical protein